jgi:hypothetical protein
VRERGEWGFDEPPDQVDLQRIYVELSAWPAIYQFAYLEQLHKHAPMTYRRYTAWKEERNAERNSESQG